MRRGDVWYHGLVLGAAALLGAGCGGREVTPPRGGDGGTVVVNGDVARGTGTVRYFDLEGGFFAIQGDDGVTYDPYATLPAAFRQDGLRVRFEARLLRDAMGIHMVGPIVELLQVSAL
jgi:hypothetical protein